MSAPRTLAVVGAGMAAARLAQQLEALGADTEVTLYGGEPEAPYNRALIADVLTGRHRPADLVVLACGVRPRTGLAHSAGLPVGRGIQVDDTLACAPGTYAIGDCAEHRGTVHGLAAPAWDQADLLARRLSGADPDARWTGTRTLARLTAGPLEYAAFGVGEAPADADVLCLGDATRGTYRRLVLRGDRLLGGALVGDLATAGTLSRAWLEGRPVGPDPLSLLRPRLAGLTDAEYFWEPVEGCWNIRPAGTS
ncbi:FAD-dependent oxidoreductase, partial [Streptomyces albidoflavus]